MQEDPRSGLNLPTYLVTERSEEAGAKATIERTEADESRQRRGFRIAWWQGLGLLVLGAAWTYFGPTEPGTVTDEEVKGLAATVSGLAESVSGTDDAEVPERYRGMLDAAGSGANVPEFDARR